MINDLEEHPPRVTSDRSGHRDVTRKRVHAFSVMEKTMRTKLKGKESFIVCRP